MHILRGVLAIFLVCSAPACFAAPSPFKPLVGAWKGSVKSEGNNCVWIVNAAVTEGKAGFTGTFSYEGKCGKKKKYATFTEKPTTPGCFSAAAVIKGDPAIQITGCAAKSGVIRFKTEDFKGTLAISKNGKRAKLSVKAFMGGAEGILKQVPSSKGKAEPESGKEAATGEEEDGAGGGK